MEVTIDEFQSNINELLAEAQDCADKMKKLLADLIYAIKSVRELTE